MWGEDFAVKEQIYGKVFADVPKDVKNVLFLDVLGVYKEGKLE